MAARNSRASCAIEPREAWNNKLLHSDALNLNFLGPMVSEASCKFSEATYDQITHPPAAMGSFRARFGGVGSAA